MVISCANPATISPRALNFSCRSSRTRLWTTVRLPPVSFAASPVKVILIARFNQAYADAIVQAVRAIVGPLH
jgi:hypothetical protein